MEKMHNLILNTDSYKASHYCQYPPGTKYISSYVEARSGAYEGSVFFGLQAYIKKYLLSGITQEDIKQAKEVILAHGLPFYEEGWQYILQQYSGALPLRIDAVAEGTLVPLGNVLCQIVNTDPKCYWLTNYIETALIRAIWYPTTVATRSYYIKQMLKEFLLKTSGSLSGLDSMLHDFGARGCSSRETSELGGMAHLLSFSGTDNLVALTAAKQYYNADMAGFSIPAAEHSTIITWGQEQEHAAYANILDKFAGQPVSVVSDSYDLYNAINNIWAGPLKEKVKNFGGVLVIRPDSGDPKTVVCEALVLIAKHFGCELNSKGYKLLPNNIRLIQGDGISDKSILVILEAVVKMGFSAENLVFGMGGELLQKVNRDQLSFAMKVSAIDTGSGWQGVSKSPSTDSAKYSKKGRLALINGKTIPESLLEVGQINQLEAVYENAKLLRVSNWQEIKERLN